MQSWLHLLTSKRFLTALLGVVASFAAALGFDLSEEIQKQLIFVIGEVCSVAIAGFAVTDYAAQKKAAPGIDHKGRRIGKDIPGVPAPDEDA